ncbi:SEC-C domain-containing protein [Xanthomonas hortorum pv. gardneri]|uniref:YecA family protein n=1 Tax=Xanthomonas hortorum TaxID=56454 RepID=UPI002FDF72B4
MKKKKRRVRKTVRPDETFSAGPFRMARYGHNILSSMQWEPGQYEAAQHYFAGKYESVVAEIDSLISEAAQLVATLPPLKLLHRAWFKRASVMLGINKEVDVGVVQLRAERMVDYVQSLVAAAPRAGENKPEISEQDWIRLEQLISKIFSTLNDQYFITATAKRRSQETETSPDIEEFHYRAQLHWANVKVDHYYTHQIQALRELLLPQTSIIESLYGLTSADLCDELAKLLHMQAFGLADGLKAMNDFRGKVLGLLESEQIEVSFDGSSPSDIFHSLIEKHQLSEERDRATGLLFGYDLLDVGANTLLPDSFLRDFSWEPGEEAEFFADGDLRGWPLRVWPTFKRPFLKLKDKYYCFDTATLFDHFYRQIEKRAFTLGESSKQKWINTRKEITEELPFNYLGRILPGARITQSIYYKAVVDDGKPPRWCELDGVATYDDHLFIVEIKAGAFTYTSPTTDAEAHLKSLNTLVGEPTKQGNRFLRYLRSNDEVTIYNNEKKEIGRLRQGDYRCISVCAVTLDAFTEIAAQSQRLSALGVAAGEQPVWTMSIDDLRVYADVFRNPFEFLHYVEQRVKSLGSKLLELDDELDHLGLYLEHNHYEQHARELTGGKLSKVQFNGYRANVDQFFHAKALDDSTESPLRQKMPVMLSELLDFLRDLGHPGAAKLTSYLLDFSGDWRDNLFHSVKQRLNESQSTPVGAMSTTGEVRITLQPWRGPIDSEQATANMEQIKAMLLLNSETDRLLLNLHFDTSLAIENVTWRWISSDEISEADRPRLLFLAEELRQKRLRAALAKGKVLRNDPCPCARGKKYKKCCLGRPM